MEDFHSLRSTRQCVRHAKWCLYQTALSAWGGAHSWGRFRSSFSKFIVDSHQQEVAGTYKDPSKGDMVQQAWVQYTWARLASWHITRKA